MLPFLVAFQCLLDSHFVFNCPRYYVYTDNNMNKHIGGTYIAFQNMPLLISRPHPLVGYQSTPGQSAYSELILHPGHS